MFRLNVLLLCSLFIIFGLLTGVSTVIGRGIDTRAAVALVAPDRARSAVNTTAKIALFDLSRSLRADHPIQLPDIRQVAFNYASLDKVFITTYVGDSRQRLYRAGLYQYDYVSSELTTIESVESDRQMNLTNGLFFSFSPILTQEGRVMTFINPLDRKPYTFDTVAKQVNLLADLEISLMSASNLLVWSRDGTKIAIRDASMLYVFNADGSQQLSYELASGSSYYYPNWSPDSRYISLERPDASSGDIIDVIDVTDGSEHPATQGLNGRQSTWWGCNGELGIAYTVAIDQSSQGYLLNLETDETTRLNDDRLLENENIEGIIPLPDCTHFLLTTEQFFPYNSSTQPVTQPLYLFDRTTQKAVLVDEITTLTNYTEEAIYYERFDPATNKRQLQKRMLDSEGKTITVSEYVPLQAAWLNWSGDMAFGTYLGMSSTGMFTGELHLLNAQTGETRPLTEEGEYVENHVLYNWSEITD
jgi:hypothetical protein